MNCKSCNEPVKCQGHDKDKISENYDEEYGYSYFCEGCIEEGATIMAVIHCCDFIRGIKGSAKAIGCKITSSERGYGFFTNHYQAKLRT
jgi:hypothetical protein